MKIQLVSDLHLEFLNLNQIEDLVTKNFIYGIRLTIGQHDTIYFGNWYIEMYCEHKVKMTDWGTTGQ